MEVNGNNDDGSKPDWWWLAAAALVTNDEAHCGDEANQMIVTHTQLAEMRCGGVLAATATTTTGSRHESSFYCFVWIIIIIIRYTHIDSLGFIEWMFIELAWISFSNTIQQPYVQLISALAFTQCRSMVDYGFKYRSLYSPTIHDASTQTEPIGIPRSHKHTDLGTKRNNTHTGKKARHHSVCQLRRKCHWECVWVLTSPPIRFVCFQSNSPFPPKGLGNFQQCRSLANDLLALHGQYQMVRGQVSILYFVPSNE